MSDLEETLDAAVAREVMGWTLSGDWWIGSDGRWMEEAKLWMPSRDIRQAWQVVERLQAAKEGVELIVGGRTVAGNFDTTTEVTIGLWGYARDDSPCGAICRAALEWARTRSEE